MIFVSGQASVDLDGQIIGDTFEGEFRRSMENVRLVLETAGSDLAHVLQTRNYVRDAEDLPFYNKLYREYFPAPCPARTTIVNCLDPSLRYEIEAVAVKRPLCSLPPTDSV
ncbi:MAG: 2-iminobutanoate/2-iminopropanoate deaminase [Verrucomicrobia bacterium]|nr:MAG: 2-iminobutanoate/2-iminopropanoate deaminase [Verrucomicrobiota bacterium]